MARVAALAVLLASTVLIGQEPQQPTRPPIFKTTLETVRVDATVIDNTGKPVTTLKVDDFTIEEDGTVQQIDQFRLLELDGHPAEGDEVSLSVASRAHALTEVAREDVRVFVVFWDDYHIAQLAAAILKDALKRFLRTNLGPTDMVAVMTQWTPASDLRFRRDHEDMAIDVDKLEPRRGIYIPRNGAEENHLKSMRGVEIVRAQVSASALRATIAHLGAIREGRKTILYFSQEFGLGRDSNSEAMITIQAANDANVVLYSVNPDGLQINRGRFGMITDIARNTGGESLSTNSMDIAIRRAVSQASATYLLGYSPKPVRHDGKFHKIAVRVKPRGLHVRARNGYWAPHPGALKSAMDAAARVPPQTSPVMKAFGELSRLTPSPLDDSPRTVRTILVPEPTPDALAVAAPLLWRIRRPADLQVVLSDTPPEPSAEREFVRTERLILRVGVSGSQATSATVTARLLGRGGLRLIELPLTRVSPGGAQWRIDFPLTAIARGDYVIAVEATNGTQQSAAYVPIRITGG